MAEKLSPILRASNLDLDAILSMAEGLPRYAKPEGMYVWKKYAIVDGAVTNPKIKIAGSTPFKVTSDNILLEHVTAEFFGGFTYLGGLSGYYLEYTGGQLYFYASGTKYAATYDPATQTITSAGNTGSYSVNGEDFGYTGDKVCKHMSEEFTFVVSDNPDAYPNGGMQDGYWYELMEEGAVGIDYGTLTLTSTTTSATMSHNLKKVPNVVFVVGCELKQTNTGSYYDIFVGSSKIITSYGSTSYVTKFMSVTNSGGTSRSDYDWITSDDKNIDFKSTIASWRLIPGTYYWFAIA